MEEGDPERTDILGGVHMVGNDHRNRHRQFPATPTPQKVKEAMVLFRGEDSHPLGNGLVPQVPFQSKGL